MRKLMDLVGADVLAHWIEKWGTTLIVLVMAGTLTRLMYNTILPYWEAIQSALEYAK